MTATRPVPSRRPEPPPTPSFEGTPPFPDAAREALADEQLRANLRRATTTIRDKRARAVAERDDWEELRLAGAAIKDEALARLPELLEELERNVTAAGGIVHWARDAAEANAIVVGLVRDTGADEVVKVKSMATQEIELNEALAAAGIAAWETDLAELIVQLGRDLPSHFLVPAIHRNRTEIRDIFVREMGLAGRPAPDGLTDDPPELAEAARLHLREKFLRAKVAISGANFAVAETGTVMVVESEGNGRMCLTLPDTLITVMGVEKLIPRWTDLEVFLQLLPRSSTAERMNPYTSMWTGVTPGDGPQTFHLVLLDNGRTATLSDPVGRQALRCIKCSACLNVCPVYERTGGRAYGSPYAGPIGAILTPQLRGIATHKVDEQTASLPYASSLCGACFEVCPVRIDIPEVLVHLRAKVVEQHGWRSTRVAGGAADGRPVRSLRGLGAARRGGAGGGRRGSAPGPPRTARSTPPARSRWRLVPCARPAGAGGAVVPTLVEGALAMTEAREAILAAVRSSLADRPAVPEVPRRYRRTAPEGTDVLERFAERVADYRADVRTVTPEGIPAAVSAILASIGARRVVVPAGVPDAWLVADGVERVPDTPPLPSAELDGIDAVITGCAIAIAETGTIVLDGGPAQGRRALTLSPTTICASSAPTRSWTTSRPRSRPSIRAARSPGSAARPPRATSSSAASRASTARATCTCSSSRRDRAPTRVARRPRRDGVTDRACWASSPNSDVLQIPLRSIDTGVVKT